MLAATTRGRRAAPPAGHRGPARDRVLARRGSPPSTAASGALLALPAAVAGVGGGRAGRARADGRLLEALNELPPGAALAAAGRRAAGDRRRGGRGVGVAGLARGRRAADGRADARRRARAAAPRRLRLRRRLRRARRPARRPAAGARRRPSPCSARRRRRAAHALARVAARPRCGRTRRSVGKRYTFTGGDAGARPLVSAVPGVAAVGAALSVEGADAFALGRRCSSSPSRATTPASSPRRWPAGAASARPDEAEVGVGPRAGARARPRRDAGRRAAERRGGALPRRRHRPRARQRGPHRLRAARARGARRPGGEPGARRRA